MEITEMLDELKQKALRDPALRAELLQTRKAAQPLSAFCQKCRELGYEVYDMDLITAGEEFYATTSFTSLCTRTDSQALQTPTL